MRVLIVEPDRVPYEKEIDSSLTAMQAVVGGSIEAIYPFEDEVALVCNEAGKLVGRVTDAEDALRAELPERRRCWGSVHLPDSRPRVLSLV